MPPARTLCLALLGPTASGKTDFSLELAQRLGAEIICMDSTTVYRGFDIGTSKPNTDQRARVPHHLVDVVDPLESFDAAGFVALAREAIAMITQRGRIPLLVGGSYFYFRALTKGMYPSQGYSEDELEAISNEFTTDEGFDGQALLDWIRSASPRTADKLHPNDQYRLLRAAALLRKGVDPSDLQPEGGIDRSHLVVKYAMAVPRHELLSAVEQRTRSMIDRGLVEETRGLMDRYPKAKALQSIGYAQAVQVLRNELPMHGLAEAINEQTRLLVKRQMTWLRSDPELRYVDRRDLERIALEVSNLEYVLGAEHSA